MRHRRRQENGHSHPTETMTPPEPPPQQAHLLPFDLLGTQVLAEVLHRVAPQLAVAPAWEGAGLWPHPYGGHGQRACLCPEADGPLASHGEGYVSGSMDKTEHKYALTVRSRT